MVSLNVEAKESSIYRGILVLGFGMIIPFIFQEISFKNNRKVSRNLNDLIFTQEAVQLLTYEINKIVTGLFEEHF